MSLVLVGMVLLARPAWGGSGVVALQTAAPSCRDQTSNVYVDCGNGTVTDNRTGLVWLANADCFGVLDWDSGLRAVDGLSDVDEATCVQLNLTAAECDCGLSDGSSPGEWRLPSIGEWKTMISDALGEAGDPLCSNPTITNDSGQGCWVSGPTSFSGVRSEEYWSQTNLRAGRNWLLDLRFGRVFHSNKGDPHYLWPVRSGQ